MAANTTVSSIPDNPAPAAKASVAPAKDVTSQEANLRQPPPEDDGPAVSSGGGMDDASYKKTQNR